MDGRADAGRAGQTEERLTRLERDIALLRRSGWTGGSFAERLPRVPVRDTLPTAAVAYAYRIIVIRGDGSTTPDVAYLCLRDAAGAWGWRLIAGIDAEDERGEAAVLFAEISDPDAPAANGARLYAKDSGAGKTLIVARFPTGAVQTIATEP
ncbi:MAG: hypothetical protein NUW01_05940 [Gemmatimonadaceae bacterium]|nr:hypothetical protein [Gemmatimonadaceae bacterium]